MSGIIAARFTTFAAVELARKQLRESGILDEDISDFYVNPGGQHARFPVGGDEYADPQARPAGMGAAGGVALGAIAGVVVAALLTMLVFQSVLVLAVATAVGAYLGSLAGAMLLTRGGGKPQSPLPPGTPHEREAGVLLAVHASPGEQRQVIDVLRQLQGKDIECANGQWQSGRWADFDPTRRVKPVSDSQVSDTLHQHADDGQ